MRNKIEKLLDVSNALAVNKKIVQKQFEPLSEFVGKEKLESIQKNLIEKSKKTLIENYQKYMPEASLDALLAFYDTPEGKQAAEAYEIIALENFNSSFQHGKEMAEEMLAEIMPPDISQTN